MPHSWNTHFPLANSQENTRNTLLTERKFTRKPSTTATIWQGVEIVYQTPLDTSSEECMLMTAHHSSDTRPMAFSKLRRSYTELPASEWAWLETIKNEQMHCVMEEELFSHYAGTGTIDTPLGSTIRGTLRHYNSTTNWGIFRTKKSPALLSRPFWKKALNSLHQMGNYGSSTMKSKQNINCLTVANQLLSDSFKFPNFSCLIKYGCTYQSLPLLLL